MHLQSVTAPEMRGFFYPSCISLVLFINILTVWSTLVHVQEDLTRIAVHSEIIRNTKDQQKVHSSSRMIGEMSREIVGTLSNLVWSIDARRDTLQELVNRMRSFGLDLLSTKDIRFRMSTNVADMSRRIAVPY